MASIRAFVAIELNDKVRRALREVQQQLKEARGAERVKWVAPENIHLTLKFLGDVDESSLPALSEALQAATSGIPPFALHVRGLDCFPNTRRPNNIWVGVEGDLASAATLAEQIEKQFATLGFERDARSFSPHLTLGRIKRDVHPTDRQAIGATVENFPAVELGAINAEAVHLIKSDLRPSGPIYTLLVTARFK